MNAVEIEQAISDLFAERLDQVEFPYAFLQAFGNKETTLKKLRIGDTNKSDVGGVLQRNNIHLAVAPLSGIEGDESERLCGLPASPPVPLVREADLFCTSTLASRRCAR